MRYVIVGNGVAGMEAALALRQREPEARIVLVSAEHDHFFARTALMYVLAGQLSLRDTEPYDRDLYARLRLERVRGRVTRVDPGARELHLETGVTVPWDRLLLAVGSRARPAPWPGAEGPGVHAFVTLQDLQRLQADLRPGDRVAVVGGGLIGVEVAEVLHLRGMKVHFLVREPWYFPVALDEAEAALVVDHVRAHGVDVRTDFTVGAVLRDERGEVTGLQSDGETLPVDRVVVTIGVVPQTDFLRGSGIALSEAGAVEVDDGLRSTSTPDVWAAGDCANVTWTDGRRAPELLWYTARDQGRAAARSMLGDEVRYRRTTWYNAAKFFDLEYTTAGFIPPPASPRRGESPLPPGWSAWYHEAPGRSASLRVVVKDGRVVGFNALGARWDHRHWLRWIQERRPLAWVLDHLHEARFDEELTAPFPLPPGR